MVAAKVHNDMRMNEMRRNDDAMKINASTQKKILTGCNKPHQTQLHIKKKTCISYMYVHIFVR